ncbi:hypothetical protein DSUL_50293 [Desulfovibrionales bacterium]
MWSSGLVVATDESEAVLLAAYEQEIFLRLGNTRHLFGLRDYGRK